MELKVGDSYDCPEGHKAKIVWISEDKKAIAVRCPEKHSEKELKKADYKKSTQSYKRRPTKERKKYARNVVFLIKI